MTDCEVLEFLLFYAIPRGNTNETAHLLLRRFGSLRNVLEATPAELMQIPGIGEKAAMLISLMPELLRRYQAQRLPKRKLRLRGSDQLGRLLTPVFIGRREECVYVLCLDKNYSPICGQMIYRGSANAVAVYVPQIVALASSVRAAGVVVAHNHPSGVALPSDADIYTTRAIARALQAVNVRLVDHLVISDPTTQDMPDGDFVSLADSNILGEEPGFGL